MEEYRVDIKVRNNTILEKLENSGYKSVGEFCRLNKVMKFTSTLGNIINMKESPLCANGGYKECINYVADKIGCDPSDLFSDSQLHNVLLNNKKQIKVNEAEMKFMLQKNNEVKLLEDVFFDNQINNQLDIVLNRLSPREKKVISLRYGLDGNQDHTLEEIGNIMDCCGQRVRQIESKALRKLRYLSNSSILKHAFKTFEDEI
jgi:RNA polymerase sigma factor (sigma-70 family)